MIFDLTISSVLTQICHSTCKPVCGVLMIVAHVPVLPYKHFRLVLSLSCHSKCTIAFTRVRTHMLICSCTNPMQSRVLTNVNYTHIHHVVQLNVFTLIMLSICSLCRQRLSMLRILHAWRATHMENTWKPIEIEDLCSNNALHDSIEHA